MDLIYLDPPFNSNANYAAPIGRGVQGHAEQGRRGSGVLRETAAREGAATAIRLSQGRAIAGRPMFSYLILAMRLLEMRRVLKATGSLWLH